MSFIPSFTNNRPLNNEEIAKFAPSVFAEEPHASRSDRYAYISTATVLKALRSEGFEPYSAKQGRSRIAGKAEFTKHMIRFRPPSGKKKTAYKVDDAIPEVILVNSHDGTSRYVITAGIFRTACLNGLIVPESLCGEVKVGHAGDISDRVIEGTWEVVRNAKETMAVVDEWSTIRLDRSEQMVLATAAHTLRFDGGSDGIKEAITPDRLLTLRRSGDKKDDLWTVTNVIQENVIKGGLFGQGLDTNNRPRQMAMREINNIDQDGRLNRAIMAESKKMADLKS